MKVEWWLLGFFYPRNDCWFSWLLLKFVLIKIDWRHSIKLKSNSNQQSTTTKQSMLYSGNQTDPANSLPSICWLQFSSFSWIWTILRFNRHHYSSCLFHSVPAIMHRDASYSSFTVLVRYWLMVNDMKLDTW